MNTFECRNCQRQFQNRTPICPVGPSHIVSPVRMGEPQILPARPLASSIPAPKAESLGAGTPLSPGDWTESDREDCTPRWKDACLYNLRTNNFRRYTRIIERRDFYSWFYRYSVDKGFQTRWALAASVVATGAYEVAIMNPGLEDLGQMLDTVSNELQAMMREGNQVIFDNVFPKLGALVNRMTPLRNAAALEWDMSTLSEEQTLIQPLYQGVSQATRLQLNRIARLQGLPGAVATFSPSAVVKDEPPYVRGGRVPAFTGIALTSIDERWRYGMMLGKQFTPGGTLYDPSRHTRPAPPAGYVNGSELARVRTRPNLHRLDALLDGDSGGTEWVQKEVEALLRRLTPAEQAEILRDQRPDGGHYSIHLRLLRYGAIYSVLASWRVDLGAQMRFLSGYIGGENNGPWIDMQYSDIAPIIRPFSQAQKNRLHTPEWQRIFTLVCDDKTILDAVRDLGLPEPLRTQWIDNEKRWFH